MNWSLFKMKTLRLVIFWFMVTLIIFITLITKLRNFQTEIILNQNVSEIKKENDCIGLFLIKINQKENKNKLRETVENLVQHRENGNYFPTTKPYSKLAKFITQNIYDSILPLNDSSSNPRTIDIPYLSCGKLKMYSKDDILKCFYQKVEKKKSFHIVFMGDSKLRQIYFDFLFLSRKLNYSIKINSKQDPIDLAKLAQLYLHHQEQWTSKTASSSAVYGFNVTHYFATFFFTSRKEFSRNSNILRLKRWVYDEEQLPDLLIVNYTYWTLLLIQAYTKSPLTMLYVLDLLFEAHELIGYYLKILSNKTRVIVMAETRTRPAAITSENFKTNAFKHAYVEFSEQFRLYHLKKHFISESNDIVDRKPSRWDVKKSDDPISEEMLKRNARQIEKKFHLKSKNTIKNLLVGGSKVWFWDSALPLHMANVFMCNKIFNENKNIITNDTLLLYNIEKKIYVNNLQQKIQILSEKKIKSKVEKNFKETPKPSKFLHILEEYVEQRLLCQNDIHTSTVVTRAEVLMIMNYLCNDVIDNSNLNSEICCSS